MTEFNILKDISDKFKIDNFEPPSSSDDLNKVLAFSPITIPDDYKIIIQEIGDAEILIGNKQYIRIWGASSCLEMNEAHEVQKYIPDSLAVGDDEGGKALIYLEGGNGFGLYLTGFGDLDSADAVYISPSISSLLSECVGVDKIYYD